jgi:DNA-directed RNA polymerase specialized sigma subunit
MRLSKEEYRKAEGCLKRYNYNCVTILNIRSDVMSIGAINYDGMPKPKYNISDSVSNCIIQLQENKYLQEALKECTAVEKALLLVNKDCKTVFQKFYVESKSKWEVVDELNASEETYKRRKRNLIYTVHRELMKLS